MLELKGNIVNLEDVPIKHFDVEFNILKLIEVKGKKYSVCDEALFGAYGSTERATFVSEMIKSYYWSEAKVNQDTFQSNFKRIWNRNITQFIQGVIKQDLIDDIELDLVDTTSSSETGASNTEHTKDKSHSSNQSDDRLEVGNVLGKSKRADNPNTTINGDLVNAYVSEAEQIENDNTLDVVNESTRTSEENETSNVVGTDNKVIESETRSNGMDNLIKLIDNSNFSKLFNDFLNSFSPLLLPVFND